MKGRDTLAEPGRRKHCRSERSERRSAQRARGRPKGDRDPLERRPTGVVRVPGVESVEGFLDSIDLYNFFPKTNKLNIQFN